MPSQQNVYWLLGCIWILCHEMANSEIGPQPCPENPIVLTGSEYGQFVYSPYDENKKYPPNTDCRFILVARTLQRRIHISVIESQLEEPLFTDCKDYVSVRDGSLPTSQEIVRWCGSVHPLGLSSSGDSLYIHFHSDNIIQSRGFNLSFVDYEVPGCPPDWISDPTNKYCYRLFDTIYGLTFVDAQKICMYERANLLTFESSEEYGFIYDQYSGSHSFPWIGYNDANKEGEFESIDPNVQNWPETFPTFKSDHSQKDCIFLDWNVRDGISHTLADCRARHSLICKKRRDGTTVPIQLSNTLIRYGLQTASFNYTLLFIILFILLIMLIILWIIYQKCKQTTTVEAVNHAQRASVQAETNRRNSGTKTANAQHNRNSKSKTSSTDALKRIVRSEIPTPAVEAALHKTAEEEEQNRVGEKHGQDSPTHAYNGSGTPRIRTHPNQPLPSDQDLNASQNFETHVQVDETEEKIEEEVQQANVQQGNEAPNGGQINQGFVEDEPPTPRPEEPQHRSHLYLEAKEPHIKVVSKPAEQQNSTSTQLHVGLPPVGEPVIHREATNLTGISSTRSRGTQVASQNFERPLIGPLDNVSAISLDEFWQRA